MNKDLARLKHYLIAQVKGQAHVIDRLCSVIIRGELGLSHPDRPKGSFLFIGPTGTGKTELAESFTEYIFGKKHLMRLDMSEFMTPSSVTRLIGDSETNIGILGNMIDSHIQGTFLFDEMEKAEPRIMDLFLQILDAGRITLGDGKVRSLSGFYIVFTSNLGSYEIRNLVKSPFTTIERIVLNHVEEYLRPELVGRISEKLVFNKLSYEVQSEICWHMLAKELKRLSELGFYLELGHGVVEFLLAKGYSNRLGARPMRSTIEKHLCDLVASEIIAGADACGRINLNETGTGLVLTPLKNQVYINAL